MAAFVFGVALILAGAAVIAKTWSYDKCDDPANHRVVIAPSVKDPMHAFGVTECSYRPSVVEKAARIAVPSVVLLVVGAAMACFARRWRLILGGGAASLTVFVSGLLRPDPIYYLDVYSILAAIGFAFGFVGAWLGCLAFEAKECH